MIFLVLFRARGINLNLLFLKPDLTLAKELKSDQSEKCSRYYVKKMLFAMIAF